MIEYLEKKSVGASQISVAQSGPMATVLGQDSRGNPDPRSTVYWPEVDPGLPRVFARPHHQPGK